MKKIKFNLLFADYSRNVRFSENYGDIQELADNIHAKGLQVPLTVEKDGERYAIISGHRRYAALKSLVEAGKMEPDAGIDCIVKTYSDELERTAGKLLANDGQPLTSDEWAAEIARLAEILKHEKGFISKIAATLGKSESYVSRLYSTWEKLNDKAKSLIKEGKVGMNLALLINKGSKDEALTSLGVQLAAAAKAKLKAENESASEAVIAEAVNVTTAKVVEAAKAGTPVSGAAIGSDLLEQVLKIKGANKAAAETRKAIVSEKEKPYTFEDFVKDSIKALQEKQKEQHSEFLQTLLLGYKSKKTPLETIENLC